LESSYNVYDFIQTKLVNIQIDGKGSNVVTAMTFFYFSLLLQVPFALFAFPRKVHLANRLVTICDPIGGTIVVLTVLTL